MSMFSYFGSSRDHYSSAANYFSQAKESAGNIVSNLWSSVSNIEAQTVKNTAVASIASWHSYEYIAGKIISTNAAIHFATCFSANSELGIATKLTQCAASALVTSPATCMVGLMATTILVANYEQIVPIVKQTANLSWEVAKTAFYTTAAIAEITLSSVLYADEFVSEALDIDVIGDIGEFLTEEDVMIA